MPKTTNPVETTQAPLTVEEIIALAKERGTGTSTSKPASPFENYVVYSAKGTYLGNFSLPENFTESSKEVVLGHLAAIGLDLREPGSSKKEITADML